MSEQRSLRLQSNELSKDKKKRSNPDFDRIPSYLDYFFHNDIYQFTMNARTQNKPISELIESAKQQFGDFSEVQKQEIFLCIKEAKTRGLLRKQPRQVFERLHQRGQLLAASSIN